ncbi:cytochrome P450 724B1-like [Humulus lupulus]|uniref:cytochrome P450 724B1-like n=1 Tax=Humulus lupulus TaxID=3486 RepID=UPI002B409024|nr:cytochrome P450 724B1-like [Humulus lupulus]
MGGTEFWLTVVVVGLSSSVLVAVWNHFSPLLFKTCPVPKGSFGWPLVGETIGFLKPHPSNSIGNFLKDHCFRYGKVFTSHLFFSPTVVSCDEELNYFILQNEGKLFECSYPKSIHGILGQSSMLVAAGDTHKRLRNVALSLVSITKSKPEFLNDIQRTAIGILHSWKDKQRVTFFEEARKFTLNVIIKQVLGLTPEDSKTTKILEDFRTFMRGLISPPLYIPGTPYAKAVKARHRISSTVKAIIKERRTSSCDDSSIKKQSDFLEILLTVDTLSEDEKVSFVLDSLLGGYETTSLLMAMVVYFLAQSPSALQQLKVEHDSIRSMKQKDEHLNWEDYRKMDFTQKVINEALRLGNIVKFVHRKAIKDVRFKDYQIPSGWKVLPIFSAVHLDSSLHSNALKFDPNRWESQDQVSKRYTPFGGGSRCCPGSELGRLEVAFFLHHLVQNFRWKVEDDEQPTAYPYVEFKKELVLSLESCS